MRQLFRGMKTDGAYPLVEQTARGLGVRVGTDVSPDSAGYVHPGHGGMSVAPDDPFNLQQHRRPPAYGGTGADTVWVIGQDQLVARLTFRADGITHGLIEPVASTDLSAYRSALAETRENWAQA